MDRKVLIPKKIQVMIILMCILAFLFSGIDTAPADPLDSWHWRNPLPQGNTLRGVTYGNGTFVAVGDIGAVLTSPDGVSWTERSSGANNSQLSGVTYGNGIFVAVGYNRGTIFSSPDGVNWSERSLGTINDLIGVTYGNGTFVAVGQSGTIITSPDGISWTGRSSATNNQLSGVTYGNGTFVAVGENGIIFSSPDGVNWTARFLGTVYYINAITYGNGTFVAEGSGTILTSPDGVNWTARSLGTNFFFIGSITYGNGTFVIVGESDAILTSPDGVSWTERPLGSNYGLIGVTYGNGTFVAVGENGIIFSSPDGVNWTARSLGTYNQLLGVTYGNGTFVTVGENGIIFSSPDGVNWTARSSGTHYDLLGVTYGDGTFVAVRPGTILSSPDGVNWTKRSSGYELNGVTYGNGTFVALGSSDTTYTSPDGVNWTENFSGLYYGVVYGVTYGNGTFVAVGVTIVSSPDGVNWTDRFPGTYYGQLNGVTYGNGIFVTVSMSGAILTSPDGVSWTERFSGTDNSLYAVTYGNGTFVAVGDSGTIRQSDYLIPSDSHGKPVISISPGAVNFGSVRVGNTSIRPVTIKNTGIGYLTVNSITIMGSNEFSQSNECQIVPPHSSCTVNITFTPTLPFGNKSAVMSIASNDPKRPTINVKLSGQAPPPKISASPMSVNFAPIPVGGTSLPKIVTIKNSGISDLVIDSISVTGSNASEVSQTNDCTTVVAKGSCTVSVTFIPTMPYGKKSAVMSIASNDPKKTTVNVKLSGQAPPPKIAVSPQSVNFGSVEVGASAAPKIVTIKNTGTSDLIVNETIIAGTNVAEFSQANNCTVVAKSGSCVITVSFGPTSVGGKTAELHISSNDPQKSMYILKLSGKGIQTGTLITSYNAPLAGSATIQATNLISITEVFSQLGNLEGVGISSESLSRLPLQSLTKKAVSLAIEQRSRADVLATGSGSESVNCPDGGSVSLTATWTGPDVPADITEISDFKATITFHSCHEETVTWNGTVKMVLDGPFVSPTKFSLTFTNLSYADSATGDSITIKNFTIAITDIGYQYGEMENATIIFNGALAGSVTGTPINQEYDDFRIEFSSVNGGLSIVMSGNMKPVCFGAWITVATNVPVFIPSGSQCPTDGEIVSKAGGNTARVVIKSDSQIEIYFSDTLLKTYNDCKEIESICIG